MTMLPPPALMTPDEFATLAKGITTEIGKVIVGQHDLIRNVLLCLVCEGHALLEGSPGLGKTQLLKTLSDVVELDFSRIQFTPDLMPADIVGTNVLEDDPEGGRRFQFRPGPIMANLVLADEVNRATPKTQSALLEAMQERSVTTAGTTRHLPRPFFVMATQNPIEMEGTYPLPEAQLDRFLLKVIVPFPDTADLVAVVNRTTGTERPDVHKVVDGPTLKAMIHLTRLVPVASHVVQHAVDLVVASHPQHSEAPQAVRDYVRFGSSPRGAQSLVLAAKAAALLDGRPNASVDDVRALAPAVMQHRMVLGYEALADNVAAAKVVADILEAVPSPGSGLRGAP